MYYKSTAVAAILGVRYHQLFELLRSKHINPPAKDSSGDYIWTDADVERARLVIAARRLRRTEVTTCA